MHMLNHVDYHLRRARQERVLADVARDPVAHLHHARRAAHHASLGHEASDAAMPAPPGDVPTQRNE